MIDAQARHDAIANECRQARGRAGEDGVVFHPYADEIVHVDAGYHIMCI